MGVLKWIGIVLAVLVGAAVGGVLYAQSAAAKYYAQHFEIDVDELPIPLPLSAMEIDALRKEHDAARKAADPRGGPQTDSLADVDLSAVALERALARGRRYLDSRAGCKDCHGADFGGKIVIDNPAMGRWVAPNITRGGVTREYTGRDWVRIIRHGVRRDGGIANMPSQDFSWFSDQEIADIAAYIQSLPPVERVMPQTKLGPVFSVLILKGDLPASAFTIDHSAPRPLYPPAIAPTVELGKHLATTCSGCHGMTLSGGPIKGGDPSWPPARNITFDPSGLGAWSLSDFEKAMREGTRPDGSKIQPPMPIPYTSRLQDAELEALYAFLRTQPTKPFGNH